ncbi:MAG: methyltransferase domain-containing protein [Candidatus Andersenbacteria bacterium]
MDTTQRYTASAGRDQAKVRTYRNLFSYFKRNEWLAERDCRIVFGDAVTQATRYLKRTLADLRVLEVGHGQHAAITLLFHSSGARATGIDMDYVRFGFSPTTYGRIARLNGIERALKTLARNILFDRRYYKTLQTCFGRPLKKQTVDLRRMDAAHMQFANATFNYVFSYAVFEHIADVESTAREVARVLKPDGVANLSIDLFPSLSGGHNLEWAFPDVAGSKRVPAWDHLRDNRYPTHVHLNRLREQDYRAIFSRYFEILETTHVYEGQRYLTNELEHELVTKGFSRDDLLTRSVRYILRPKK